MLFDSAGRIKLIHLSLRQLRRMHRRSYALFNHASVGRQAHEFLARQLPLLSRLTAGRSVGGLAAADSRRPPRLEF